MFSQAKMTFSIKINQYDLYLMRPEGQRMAHSFQYIWNISVVIHSSTNLNI